MERNRTREVERELEVNPRGAREGHCGLVWFGLVWFFLQMGLGLALVPVLPKKIRMEEVADPRHQCLGLQPLGCLLEHF